jgi:hypothetical protein
MVVAGVDLASIVVMIEDVAVASSLVPWLHAVSISNITITKMNFFIR